MKISTIIPVYNAERFLRRCLESVLEQSIEEKEIICVDDGSTDRSLEILREYERAHNNVHVLTQENKHAGIARNYGLSMAQGEYVHFLDADDYLAKKSIYSIVYDLAVRLGADYIKTRNYAFDMGSGNLVKNIDYSLGRIDAKYFNKLLSFRNHSDIVLKICVTPWSGWVRRSYIQRENILFDDLQCVNDRSFHVEALCHTERIVLCDDYMVMHQINNKDSLVGKRDDNFICVIKSYQLIEGRTQKLPDALRRKVLGVELCALAATYWYLPDKKKKDYADLVRFFSKDLDLNEFDSETLLNPEMRAIYHLLGIHFWDLFDSRIAIHSIVDLKRYFTEGKNTVIYGAGRVCARIIECLTEKERKMIAHIVVSEAKGNSESVCGIPVEQRTKEILDQAQTIIIAALEPAEMSIYQSLMHLGYHNVYVVGEMFYEKSGRVFPV